MKTKIQGHLTALYMVLFQSTFAFVIVFFICMIDPTHICLSPISQELLEIFQGIVCNNERLKGGSWSHELLGER